MKSPIFKFLLLINLCLFASALNLSAANDQANEVIHHLVYSIEFDADEHRMLQTLSIDSIPLMVEIMAKIENTSTISRVIYVVREKYQQFENELSEADKARYAQALVEGSKRSPRKLLPLNLINLEFIRRPEVLEYALTLTNDVDPNIQKLAKKLVLCMNKSGVVSGETLDTFPAPTVSSSNQSESPRELSENNQDSPVQWGILIVLFTLVIGLARWFFMKKRG